MTTSSSIGNEVSTTAAVVYQLDPANSEASLFFLKADDNILFFLDQEKNLMPGNGNFSYTLNKSDEIPKN